jgi:Rrf2 family nitric oxide-sensitive transcriptional repressor
VRLTAHTDYGLRVLMSLAVAPERVLSADELSRRHGLSKNHLMKVGQSLVRLGVAEAVRGRSGGLRLARPASQIRIGDAARSLEEDVNLVARLGDGPSGCVLQGACRLTRAMQQALEAFFAELNRFTLADLTASSAALRARLGLEPMPVRAMEKERR